MSSFMGRDCARVWQIRQVKKPRDLSIPGLPMNTYTLPAKGLAPKISAYALVGLSAMTIRQVLGPASLCTPLREGPSNHSFFYGVFGFFGLD